MQVFFPASSTGHFEVITPNPTVSILLGKEALLVCQLLPARNAEAMEIRWTQIRDDKEKLIYQKGRNEIQGEAYRGQTHLLTSAMQRGTVSLLIGNVTLADQGKYGCDFQSPDFFNSAEQELQVTSECCGAGCCPELGKARPGGAVMFLSLCSCRPQAGEAHPDTPVSRPGLWAGRCQGVPFL